MSLRNEIQLPADLKALSRIDTPTICNAIELFAVRPPTAGYMDRSVSACFPDLPPMVGYAATATFRSSLREPSDSPPSDLPFRQLEELSSLPGPAVIVFQDLDDPPVGATFGDGMCLTYQTFGAAGLITSGAARDVDQLRALQFPCFSNGVICGHGDCRIEAINVPVTVGGLTIHPGDLLHGDGNGVTTIPLEIAAAIPDVCERYLKCEADALSHLRSGVADHQVHRKAIADFQNRLAELRRELQTLSEES